MNNHIECLKKKHAELKHIINKESLRPCPNLDMIHKSKQKKLRLKDEIYSLIHPSS